MDSSICQTRFFPRCSLLSWTPASSRCQTHLTLQRHTNGATIRAVSFSNTNLFDVDFPAVVQLVLGWKSSVVSLSNTRIHGYDSASRSVVDSSISTLIEKVDTLDVSGTPFATVDRRDFFSALPNTSLQKLIWIPKNWVPNKGWSALVDDKTEKVKIVAETHAR
jgi:hypothetical protein